MTSPTVTACPDQSGPVSFSDRQPIAWISTVADRVAREANLVLTADIEDLVIIAYQGLLDSPHPDELTLEHLLTRCRQQLVTWAWEQGRVDEPMPTPARTHS